ncbi:MAG: glycosyltransferase family 9 protein [Crocinitomicaceae bacterium]|jgi:ADP-heptose:LPS heptosyltransferase|nr:glycosyltransferase family 9 protein [Crocinitomicaceae bacterium]
MDYSSVKFDCRKFRTGIPCKPNKESGQVCNTCTEYDPIKKRILIIKLGALGDVIRTTPLIEKFKSEYEGAHFTWLTLSPAILPAKEIDVIYKYDVTSVYIIENSEFDIAINLDKDPEACILLRNVVANEKLGYTWEKGHIAPATPSAEHKLITGFFDQHSKANTKSYLEEIFEICGFEFQREDYLINLNHELSTKWKSNLIALSEGKQIVGLNTGCGPRWNTRLWSEESWIQLATDLRQMNFFPIFLGGELEDEKNSRMAKEAKIYYPGHFSLEEFIGLTDACDVVVTQVSMMMHIATALKKKLVLCNTIFNSHEFELYDRGVLVEPSTGCECYYGNTCVRGKSCMHDITPDQILSAVKSLVKTNN